MKRCHAVTGVNFLTGGEYVTKSSLTPFRLWSGSKPSGISFLWYSAINGDNEAKGLHPLDPRRGLRPLDRAKPPPVGEEFSGSHGTVNSPNNASF